MMSILLEGGCFCPVGHSIHKCTQQFLQQKSPVGPSCTIGTDPICTSGQCVGVKVLEDVINVVYLIVK